MGPRNYHHINPTTIGTDAGEVGEGGGRRVGGRMVVEGGWWKEGGEEGWGKDGGGRRVGEGG